MKLFVSILLANIALAFTGLPLPKHLQKKWGFLMNENKIGRIFGGTAVANGERPFQIRLKKDGIPYCGGSFIGTRTVLTAAHCVHRFVIHINP